MIAAPLRRVPKNTDIGEIASIFARDGALIIENFLTPDQVQRLNDEFDEPLRKLSPSGQLDEVPDEAREFLGVNTKRLSDLISLSKTWRDEVVNDDLMHGVCEEFLTKGAGGYWLSTAQMIEIGPGNPEQALHRDFQPWWPNFLMPPTAPETLINFLIATTDTTEENGATRAIPGSHLWSYSEGNHNLGSSELAQSCPLKAGDALLIGGRIVHGGGRNSTEDCYRRIVSVSVVANCFTPEEAFALIVPRDEARKLPHRVQSFLGFRSQYPKGAAGVWSKDAQDIGYQLGFGRMEGIAGKHFAL